MMNEQKNNPTHYQIIVAGQLDGRWQAWFDELTLTTTADGNTMLSGSIRDQPALHGILKKINNLGLTLISINPDPLAEQ